MPTPRKHLLEISIGMIAAIICGALIGYFASRALVLQMTQARLRQYAQQTLTEADTASLESRSMLAAMKTAQASFCSDDDIASFRNLIFLSEYLKEAGRIRDGRIECSAKLGRLKDSIPLPKPDFVRSDGSKIYTKLDPFRIGDMTVVSLQLGDAYIVFSPYIETHRAPAPVHSTVVAIDASDQSNGASPEINGQILNGSGNFHPDGNIFVTLCSDHYSNCITEFVAVSDALLAAHNQLREGEAVGGLFGVGAGFIGIFFYRRRFGMVSQLRRAVRHGRLRLVYQSIVNPVNGHVVGAEALSRWTNEDGIEVEPNAFIRIAEEHKFVGAITKQVVRQTLRDFRDTMLSHPGFRISVNVTAADLDDERFLPMVEDELKRAQVPPENLAVEICEGSHARTEGSLKTIRKLRDRGHRVLLDDFGTGFSSLSYLSANAVDAIKIDNDFTHAIGTDESAAAVLPEILAMAKKLKLQVVVEGIETTEQAKYFTEGGWPILAQGWFFGRPVPYEVFHDWLADIERREEAMAQEIEEARNSSSDSHAA